MIELPRVPPGIRLLTNPEMDRLRTRFPNFPATPKDCITCRGVGVFHWWHPDEKNLITEWKCDCAAQWMLHLYFLHANVGTHYQRLDWTDATAVEVGAIDAVDNYFRRSEGYMRAGCGLILHGGVGSGKTLLATLLLKGLLGRGYDGYFTTFSDMIDTYTGGWNSAEERQWFHRRIKNTQVLVMDDVGREYQGRAKTGLPESTFDEVLRHRVAAGTPTIITTNLEMEDLQSGYGGNVMSLLHERSTNYRFTGADFRDKARLRLEDEVERGLTRPVMA